MDKRPLRVLLFSTLYPSATRPGHGIFVETRLRELMRGGRVAAQVLSPVPWFPLRDKQYGDKARMAQTPLTEKRDGVQVDHPRYVVIPKVGMMLAPLFLALAGWMHLRKIRRLGDSVAADPDVIDAHYFYPDGVAAALIAAWMRKPLVITARGSDVNLIAEHALPRAMMRWASRRAAASVGVSQALARRLLDIGAPPEAVHVLRNGVDTRFFQPQPKEGARRALGLPEEGLLLISVGNLLPVKRHDLVIDALSEVRRVHPTARLAIVGGGLLESLLRARAQSLGLAEAVFLVGPVPQSALSTWYSAADVLVLASSREGWPNVLLEAMACGTPVVASDVGGVREIVSIDVVGTALVMQSGVDVSQAVLATLERATDRAAIRAHAESLAWGPVSDAQFTLLNDAAGRPCSPDRTCPGGGQV